MRLSSARTIASARSLRGLQLQDLLLDGIPRDEPEREHGSRLSNPVRAVDR
jgi:hypothetical protein